MKLIDLLVKIANGKEVPKKLRIFNTIFNYIEGLDYKAEDKETYLFSNYILINKKDLNIEVEIIEDTPKEDKKIEKIKDYRIFKTMGLDCKYNERKEPKYYSLEEKEIVDKINGE